ncbi:MAG: hypothetical protein Q9159_002122 [Coniocarpon cinnabarinum]
MPAQDLRSLETEVLCWCCSTREELIGGGLKAHEKPMRCETRSSGAQPRLAFAVRYSVPSVQRRLSPARPWQLHAKPGVSTPQFGGWAGGRLASPIPRKGPSEKYLPHNNSTSYESRGAFALRRVLQILAGNADIPLIYNVERVRDGNSFSTRTVQARQQDAAIFTTTLSFMKEGSGGAVTLEHQTPMPDVPPPMEDETEATLLRNGPFESQHLDVVVPGGVDPEAVRTRSWLRARGRISKQGTVGRAHRTWRSPPKPDKNQNASNSKYVSEKIRQSNGGHDENVDQRKEIGMMVSLGSSMRHKHPKTPANHLSRTIRFTSIGQKILRQTTGFLAKCKHRGYVISRTSILRKLLKLV